MVRRIRAAFIFVGACVVLGGCDQLGNPPQFAMPPTSWKDANGHLVTTTRSFKNEQTIRRLVADEMEEVDYTDASIGPSETLTIVAVVARALHVRRGPRVRLVTRFTFRDRRTLDRRWTASGDKEKWTAAFALPDVPERAVTVVAP